MGTSLFVGTIEEELEVLEVLGGLMHDLDCGREQSDEHWKPGNPSVLHSPS
jgi:hypothetical protein